MVQFMLCRLTQISHAITLQKTVEYIAKLQQERSNVLEETRRLREEVEELNIAIKYGLPFLSQALYCELMDFTFAQYIYK